MSKDRPWSLFALRPEQYRAVTPRTPYHQNRSSSIRHNEGRDDDTDADADAAGTNDNAENENSYDYINMCP